jgi:hypothetical protein
MKAEFFVEFEGQQKNLNNIADDIKSIWKTEGNKMKDLKSLKIYYKPEENKAYYVLNGDSNGEEDSIVV